ncbi:hypothetical protein HRbin01_01170 [archaeon HR01]|nr:hypothetical protein HRbin01_01170 [archaeon HR01]
MIRVQILMLFLVVMVIGSAYGLEPPPSGTAYGTSYVRVVDCATDEALQGASVTLENPGHSVSGTTNATGYAILDIYAWYYSYYVTLTGYSIAYGERRFSIDTVFTVCLRREIIGSWHLAADVTMWQGDIHAGGSGWAIIRMKNLEPGYFRISSFEIWVSGYSRPIAITQYQEPETLGRSEERLFNITINPPQDAPVGRLSAELRVGAVFTYDDGRSIGPLTAPVSLGYVEIRPYRTFRLRVMDFLGTNPVPNITLVMENTLAGAWSRHVLYGDSNGFVDIERLQDGVYRVWVYYTSPYDGETYTVKLFTPLLSDLAKNGMIRTSVYDAYVEVIDLAGRRLDAAVSLGWVSTQSMDGVARFKNVPRGVYPVKILWRGVEVFNGSILVDEPFVKTDPGGYLQARAEVGDLILSLKDVEGRSLRANVSLSIQPLDIKTDASRQVSFIQLPRGAYTITAQYRSWLDGATYEVGRYTFNIPEDHGEHELRLGIHDVELRFIDRSNRTAPVEAVSVNGRAFQPVDGVVKLEAIPRAIYHIVAEYLGKTVFDERIQLPGDSQLLTSIHPFRLHLKTLDGEPLINGHVLIYSDGRSLESNTSEGLAVFNAVPGGLYRLVVEVAGERVYDADLEVASEEAEIIVGVGRPAVKVVDQYGSPLEAVEVVVEGIGSSKTSEQGVALFGQAPAREYTYKVLLYGAEYGIGKVKAGETASLTLHIFSLKVRVVNQMGEPVPADIVLLKGDRAISRGVGPSATFTSIPQGGYRLLVTYGPKQVENQVELIADDREVTVVIPYAFYLGPGVMISLNDFWLLALPLMLLLVVTVSVLAVRKTVKKVSARRERLPRI